MAKYSFKKRQSRIIYRHGYHKVKLTSYMITEKKCSCNRPIKFQQINNDILDVLKINSRIWNFRDDFWEI